MATAVQVMMRLKNTKNLDARQSMLLDNAYFAVRPPERLGARRKKRAPEHEYMRHLVRECLSKDQVKPVWSHELLRRVHCWVKSLQYFMHNLCLCSALLSAWGCGSAIRHLSRTAYSILCFDAMQGTGSSPYDTFGFCQFTALAI